MPMLRTLRRHLQGSAIHESGGSSLFTQHRYAYAAASYQVRFLYIATLWFVLNRLVSQWLNWRMAGPLDLVWPVIWFQWVDPVLGADLIGSIALITILLVVLFPQRQLIRIIAFAGFLILIAFSNSFGKINHDMHAWMAFVFAFMFIPAGNWKKGAQSTRFRQHFLTAVWFGMALMALFYSMSGLLKVYGIGYQLVQRQVSAIHPYGLAFHVVGRLMQTNSESILGPTLLDYPWAGWPLLIGAVYLEFFAIVAVFRPRLHLWWGLGLIALHLGNWLLLSIPFTANIFLLALFFVYSPFRPAHLQPNRILGDLPLIGWLFQGLISTFARRPKGAEKTWD